jgi:N-ethylmaleimide reductase
MKNEILFNSYDLAGLSLKNRIIMAPMTRSRAIGNTPNELMVKYYSERADAGLIITEGTAPGPDGLGYARIPGLFSEAQVIGWKKVTNAVHANGGRIFVQLMHTGRIGHGLNLPKAGDIVGPSPIAAAGEIWTDEQGMQPMPVPKEIPANEIQSLITEFVKSAEAAMAAGFDGVEIHAANGYLPMQFLNPASNQRTDKYGGSYENRNRFVLEMAKAMAGAIGKEKLGIRLSPFNKFNDMVPDEHEAAQYISLAEGLKKTGIAYIHLLRFAMPAELIIHMRDAFGGTVILNGGYNAENATADLEAGKAELISFGSSFIANPDLVTRMKNSLTLARPDASTFYTPGENGYTDYLKLVS